MLTRLVQSVQQFTVSQLNLVLTLSFVADFIMSALLSMLLLANSLMPFSVCVDKNAMNFTLKLVTFLYPLLLLVTMH